MTAISRWRMPGNARMTSVHAAGALTPRLFAPRVLFRVVCRAMGVLFAILWAFFQLAIMRVRGRAAARVVSRCAMRILAIGKTHIELLGYYRSGGGLVVSNHRSYLDILAILSVTPCSFLCKKEVSAWPMIGTMAERMGVVFVDRSSRESRALTLERIGREVVNGAELAAFPEGTTSRGPGMRPTYPGLFRAAETLRFRVVPMVIEYADPEDAWVEDDTLLRHLLYWLSKPRSHVTVRFAEPMTAPTGESGELQARVERWMHGALMDVNRRYRCANAALFPGAPGVRTPARCHAQMNPSCERSAVGALGSAGNTQECSLWSTRRVAMASGRSPPDIV